MTYTTTALKHSIWILDSVKVKYIINHRRHYHCLKSPTQNTWPSFLERLGWRSSVSCTPNIPAQQHKNTQWDKHLLGILIRLFCVLHVCKSPHVPLDNLNQLSTSLAVGSGGFVSCMYITVKVTPKPKVNQLSTSMPVGSGGIVSCMYHSQSYP